MEPTELLGAGGILLLTVVVGTVFHELTHVLSLRAIGVPYRVEWFTRRRNTDGLDVTVPLATVTPVQVPGDRNVGLRISAMAPLLLVSPLVAVVLGYLPDPFASGNVYLLSMTIGWVACALPSPQDFAVFWYPDRVLDRA
jgi:hypothetical protein